MILTIFVIFPFKLVTYLHKRSHWKQVQVYIESQDSKGDGGDVVQAHLEQLGGQEQQAQIGSSLSVAHTEICLREDACEVIFRLIQETRWRYARQRRYT